MLKVTEAEREVALGRIEAMRAAGLRIEHTIYNGHVIAFRKPDRAQAQWYRTAKADPASAASADENLAKAILVEPTSAEALDAIVEEYPFALVSDDVSHTLARALGLRQAEEKKAPPSPPTINDSSPKPSATA